jgi:hypothetical protein
MSINWRCRDDVEHHNIVCITHPVNQHLDTIYNFYSENGGNLNLQDKQNAVLFGQYIIDALTENNDASFVVENIENSTSGILEDYFYITDSLFDFANLLKSSEGVVCEYDDNF